MRTFYLIIALSIFPFESQSQETDQTQLPPISMMGSQPVGRVELYLKDGNRTDIASPNRDNRIFNIHIWYPSKSKRTTNPTLLSQSNDLKALMGEIASERYGDPYISLSQDSQLSDTMKAYPVLLFSPGFGMNKGYYSSFCHYLAQHNFIVISIDHSYLNKTVLRNGQVLDPKDGYFDSYPATKPASSVEAAQKRFKDIFQYLNSDIDFILERLHAVNRGDLLNARFKNRLDLDRMAHIGHSAGALVTKSLMSKATSDFSAFVTLDVRLDREFLSATEYVEIPNQTEQPILMFALEYVQQYAPFPTEEFLRGRKGNFHHISLKDTGHSAMTDLDYLFYQNKGETQKAEHAEKTMFCLSSATLDFLKTYLK